MTTFYARFFLPDQDEAEELVLEAESETAAIDEAKQRFDGLERVFTIGRDPRMHDVVWEANPSYFLKWMTDGHQTLDEVVATLRQMADELEELRSQGFSLATPVDNGHVILQRPSEG